MRFAATLSDFFTWWLDELAGMFPVLAKRFDKPAQAELFVGTQGGVFPVLLHNGDPAEGASADSIETLNALLVNSIFRKGESLEISVFPGRFVERKLSDKKLPASRAIMMAEVDVNSNTPFKYEDVLVTFPERSPPQSGTTYFIFRRNDLQQLLQTVRRAGFKVTSIGIRNGDVNTRMRHRDLRSITGNGFFDKLTSWMRFAIIGVLAFGLVTTWFLEVRRLNDAERLLSVRVDDARKQAGRIRVQYDARMKLLDQMASIRNEKNLTNSAVYLWEQLSRTLPDDSWLTDMKIADGLLTVSGYSQSAASLISLIENTDGFSDPEFRSAVVKAPNVDAERFTLEASIDGPQP